MRFRRSTISVLSIIAILLTTTFITGQPAPKKVQAASISDYQEQIKDLEAEQKEIEDEIKKLNSDKTEQKKQQTALQKRIDNLQSQINLCNSQLKSFEEQIEQLEQNIKDKEAELEETRYIFKQRLRALYMSGGLTASSLSVLLSADDLSDLLTKTEATRVISAYDNALMKQIMEDVDKIDQNKADILKLQEEQKAVKTTLNSKKKELNSQISDVNSTISDIQSDINSLKNQAAKLDAAIAEYEQAIKDAQNIGKDQHYDGQFSWPCPGYYNVTSPYGYRIHPISGKRKFHKGIDIAGSGIKGKPIVAAADGIVSIATYNTGGYGYYVMVNHGTASNGKSYVTLYAHMTKYIVSVGQKVKRGQTIGYVGTSGASTGYHLHFEVRVNGDTTNPMSYF